VRKIISFRSGALFHGWEEKHAQFIKNSQTSIPKVSQDLDKGRILKIEEQGVVLHFRLRTVDGMMDQLMTMLAPIARAKFQFLTPIDFESLHMSMLDIKCPPQPSMSPAEVAAMVQLPDEQINQQVIPALLKALEGVPQYHLHIQDFVIVPSGLLMLLEDAGQTEAIKSKASEVLLPFLQSYSGKENPPIKRSTIQHVTVARFSAQPSADELSRLREMMAALSLTLKESPVSFVVNHLHIIREIQFLGGPGGTGFELMRDFQFN